MNTYLDSVTHLNDGSYMVKFPWKDNHAPLPSNFQVCERRTRSLACRLIQTPTLMKSYNEIIKEQERKGFIEKVISEPMPNQVYCIPHHPMRNTTIKLVFDHVHHILTSVVHIIGYMYIIFILLLKVLHI